MNETTSKEKMTIEVLVATMHQHDLSLIDRMHLNANAIVANQCEEWGYCEIDSECGRVRMISTQTVGVGLNRNIALQMSQADILLFADDDIEYYDGAFQNVLQAFADLPEADVIFFGIDMTRNGKVVNRFRDCTKRCHLWNSLKYGTCRMAVRRESIIKNRIAFSQYFGGGCRYSCGEDTIFICDCLRAGLKLYAHSSVLGTCSEDSSTWFFGYDDKHFFDRGALLACALPKIKHIVKWYFAIKLTKLSGIPLVPIVRQMNKGIKAFKHLQAFEA